MSDSTESKFNSIVTSLTTIATLIIVVIGGWGAGWNGWKPVTIAIVWIVASMVKVIARKDSPASEE